jgi:hypothetical protein
MPGGFHLRDDRESIKIQDTGKGAKSVAEDLEAVLRKIESWHQGSIAAARSATGTPKGVSSVWNGAGNRRELAFSPESASYRQWRSLAGAKNFQTSIVFWPYALVWTR